MAAEVKISRLEDGRVGVALAGESGGFYAWTQNDAIYIAVALMRFFDTEAKELKPVSEEIETEPIDVA